MEKTSDPLFTEKDFQEAKNEFSESMKQNWIILFIILFMLILLGFLLVCTFAEMGIFWKIIATLMSVIIILVGFRRCQRLYEDKKSRGILVDLYQKNKKEDLNMTKESVMLKVGLWPRRDIHI